MNIDIIIKVIIPFIAGVLVYIVIPFVKSKTTIEQRELVYGLVKASVFAAEQIFKYNNNNGVNKKEYVLNYIKSKGIDITDEDLDMLIESAVYELNLAKGSVVNGESKK